MSNPFEDPSQSAYGDNTAYSQTQSTASGPPPPPPAQTQTYQVNVNVNTQPNAQSNAQPNVQSSAYAQPNTQSSMNSTYQQSTTFIERCYNWVPIHWIAFLAGCLFVALAIIDIAFSNPQFVVFFVDLYLVIFGLLIMSIEMPAIPLARKIQLSVFYWARFLSRIWGRVCFYIFTAFLCFCQLENGFNINLLSGIFIIIVALLMCITARTACVKYLRIFTFIASGHEGDDLVVVFQRKFEELDIDKDNFISGDVITKIATDAGLQLTNAERYAIITFLDVHCNGRVSKEDWIHIFTTYNNIKTSLRML